MNKQEELFNRIKANPKLGDIKSCGKPALLEFVKHFQVFGITVAKKLKLNSYYWRPY